MALARVKTWSAGEVLTASDLNTEFNNIINNATSLISPVGAAFDFDGNVITLDAAAATSLVSSSSVSWNFTSGAKTGTPATTGSVANWSAQTFTDNNTAGSGTATAFVAHGFQRPTLAASNASVTTTDAATVYIANSPAAGSNETITNAYALWVDAGNVRFDGTLILPDGSAAAPSLKVGDEQNGLYSPAANTLGITLAGTLAASLAVPAANTLGITVGGAEAVRLRSVGLSVPDGLAATPSIKVGDEESGLYSPASSQLGFVTAGQTSFRIDDSQRFLHGAATAITIGTAATRFEIAGAVPDVFSVFKFGNDSDSANWRVGKSRDTTIGSHTVVQDNDELFRLAVYGSDGTDFSPAAMITVDVDDTPGNNDMPGRIVMRTSQNGTENLTEALRIDSSQCVGIGNTDPSATARLTVAETANRRALQASTSAAQYTGALVNSHATTPFGLLLSFSGGAPDDNTQEFIRASDTGAIRFLVYADGDVQNHDNSYAGISDERLKTNIVDAGSQFDDFRAYRFRNFEFISDVEAGKPHRQIGLIAQEVLPISPGLVTQGGDGMYAIQYSVLAVKAAKAVQELIQRTDELTKEIERLKAGS